MGLVEKLTAEYEGILAEQEVKERLQKLRREVIQDWKAFKRYHTIMHGSEIKDSLLDVILVHLIKKGVL